MFLHVKIACYQTHGLDSFYEEGFGDVYGDGDEGIVFLEWTLVSNQKIEENIKDISGTWLLEST